MRRDVTIVMQRAQREIDGTARDSGTCIAYFVDVVPDHVRLERGARTLIQKTADREGIHYGIIDPSGQLVGHGSMLSTGKVETVSVGRHSHADLRGASLWNANLEGADFTGANLEDADLDYAKIRGAILFNANIRRATLPVELIPRDEIMKSVETGCRIGQSRFMFK